MRSKYATTTPKGRLSVLVLIGILAEFRREVTHGRTGAGMMLVCVEPLCAGPRRKLRLRQREEGTEIFRSERKSPRLTPRVSV